MVARLAGALAPDGPVAWWIVDPDWTELQARGGNTDVLFELGPLDGADGIYRRIPAADRAALMDLPGTGRVLPRCRVVRTDGSVRVVAVAAREMGSRSLAYLALDMTDQARVELDREATEQLRAAELEHLQGVLAAHDAALDEAAARIEQLRADLEQQEIDLALERRARRHADERVARQDEALARVVHDLRAPLNTISGFADLLGRDELDPERSRWLDHIRSAASHLLDTSELLLQLVAASGRRTAVEVEELALAPLVAQALTVVGHPASEREVTLDAQVPDTVRVLADRRLLSQVLANLLGNAIDHTPAGGRVTVTTEDSGTFITLLVADTGPGIPAEALGNLFEPFRRAGDDRERTTGAGLGLAICREHVEAMHGSIGALNAAGGGACFWVDLPSTVRPPAGAPLVLVGTRDRATGELVGVALRDRAAVRILRTRHALVHAATVDMPDAVFLTEDLGHGEALADLVAELRASEAAPSVALFTTGANDLVLDGVTVVVPLPATPERIRAAADAVTRARG